MDNTNTKVTSSIKTKYIHSNKLAGYLIMSGCKILKVKKNLKNPAFNIFLFIDNEKLQTNIATFMRDKEYIDEMYNNINNNYKILGINPEPLILTAP